jgi:arylsulfatase A-like enzyme
LIIRHPHEKKPNTIDSRLAIHMDVTATLLNATSVPIEDLDGIRNSKGRVGSKCKSHRPYPKPDNVFEPVTIKGSSREAFK